MAGCGSGAVISPNSAFSLLSPLASVGCVGCVGIGEVEGHSVLERRRKRRANRQFPAPGPTRGHAHPLVLQFPLGARRHPGHGWPRPFARHSPIRISAT